MFELRKLSRAGVPGALEKVERYRLLNEPRAAESIWRDVLEADPGNQRARISLILALTDQFGSDGAPSPADVLALIADLEGEGARAYYTGIIHERYAKARFARRHPGSGHVAYDAFRSAMESYDRAQELAEPGDDSALLRWNTCARMLNRYPSLAPAPHAEPTLLE
jgi:hypothetical protein